MTVAPSTKSLTVSILTGATGRTCDDVLRAVLAQFDEPSVRPFPSARSTQSVGLRDKGSHPVRSLIGGVFSSGPP